MFLDQDAPQLEQDPRLKLLMRIIQRRGAQGPSALVDLFETEASGDFIRGLREVLQRAKAGGARTIEGIPLNLNEQGGRSMMDFMEALGGRALAKGAVPAKGAMGVPIEALENFMGNREFRSSVLERLKAMDQGPGMRRLQRRMGGMEILEPQRPAGAQVPRAQGSPEPSDEDLQRLLRRIFLGEE